MFSWHLEGLMPRSQASEDSTEIERPLSRQEAPVCHELAKSPSASCFRAQQRRSSISLSIEITKIESKRLRTSEGFEHVVHVSVGTFPTVWSGDRRSIAPEAVHPRVVVQVAPPVGRSTGWAMSTARRFRARGTCVRGHIFVRMEWRLTVDRA